MQTHFLKTSSLFGALFLLILFFFIGAGCLRSEKNQVVLPVEAPVAALIKAKELTIDEQARMNAEADSAASDLTVAVVLTDGAKPPEGMTPSREVFGCNDRIVYTKIHREVSTDNVVHDALTTLFAIKDPSFQNLYNGLWQSTLSVDKIQSRDGMTTEVWLKGHVNSGGVCDDPRVKAQIEGTIKRLKPKYKIFLNGSESEYRCIGDMSGECK